MLPDFRFSDIERHEAKYIIPAHQVHQVRSFIKPFCQADAFCTGTPPSYLVTTLQLDNLMGDLWRAKERKSINRFKLRIRTYGEACDGPVFMEIKRKINGLISKSRASLPERVSDLREALSEERAWQFRNERETRAYLDFLRLTHTIGARPTIFIRYRRESYIGLSEDYARVTIDSELGYRPARGWRWPKSGSHWRSFDTTTGTNTPFSGYILELKSGDSQPLWMAELIQRFNLVRSGFCKYSTAMRLESVLQGWSYSDASENCTY
ncbi:MAG: polyphosphate polymerase domain-containing protein [Verrucomicrobiota bacterium]|nr:polyphosphate polymerase domain-containing protein [Verrucomicrobiota bacterium]